VDIQKSDIDSLEERVKKLSYHSYLPALRMSNVRSFEQQTISFDFPVTAIIGTNGGGKSTVLGAAAIAYKSVKPGNFFPKSNIGDNSMANWRIDYDIIDRSVNAAGVFTRNARFASAKWRRDNVPDREVILIPIQRTVPANEQNRFKQFIGLGSKTDITAAAIDVSVSSHVSRILGKDASGYERITLNKDRSKSILVGMKNANDYSQFHFGAGEASIIEMVSQIEGASDNALILIEEIENGLHPLATRKMVEYLFDVAKRKKAQVIFTTHSEYALDVLPPKAIWGCIDGVAYQGKLTIESLRALTGTVRKDRAIFVEDEFAKDLCSEILRQYAPEILDQVEIHKAGGFPYVVEVLKHHNTNPTIKNKAVAVIDGDNPPLSEVNDHVVELPEGAPEAVVFGYIQQNAEVVASLVQQRCQCPAVSQDRIIDAIKQVAIDTTDHHLYFVKLGEMLGFISEIIVRRGLCSIYVQNAASELSPLVSTLKEKLID
jgi:predicted ATPase